MAPRSRRTSRRRDYELYAGVRPVKAYPTAALRSPTHGRPGSISVILRELTEGLFASRGKGIVEDDQIARPW